MALPILTTLLTFNGAGNGSSPIGGLIADAAGDLFGTTEAGGTNNVGTVFGIPKTATGFGAPTTLVTFSGANGANPEGGLIADAAGDLVGTTAAGGANSDGTVFEIPKTATGFGAPTTLVTFNGTGNGATPVGGLIADAAGDLFGTTGAGGANSKGTVFEIPKTATGFGAPTTLVTFNGAGNGATPFAGLIADAAGDLFGTTEAGGANNAGTVFEIPKTAIGFGALTTLVTFTGAGNGAAPFGGLIADAAGDLFGTTEAGGTNSDGTVFEIPKTGTGSTGFGAPTTLVTFNGTGNGAAPFAGLIADAAGDLFGTTEAGGTNGDGTVFEIPKTATGFGALINLVNFDGAGNGSNPSVAGLIANAAGDLFGTTEAGGGNSRGTVFELTNTGFILPLLTITGTAAGQAVTDQATHSPFSKVTVADGNSGQIETVTVTLSAAANGTLSNMAGGAYDAVHGIYTITGAPATVTTALDGLVFTPTIHQVAAGQTVTTSFTINVTDAAGLTTSDSSTSVVTTATPPATTPPTTTPQGFPPDPAAVLGAFDTTTNTSVTAIGDPYDGPVAGLEHQYINITSDSLNIMASSPNWFIHSGSGEDALAVNSGTNVLDGGTGSNFLTGTTAGNGTDTFFVDDRGATADIWSTVVNFHAGDSATVWGVTPQDFALNFVGGQGAGGFTGLTLHATANGKPTASLTLAGFTQADMHNGRVSVQFGTDSASGSSFMFLHANS
jgi:uncharacterized repeat protein (TIGR03803 family)